MGALAGNASRLPRLITAYSREKACTGVASDAPVVNHVPLLGWRCCRESQRAGNYHHAACDMAPWDALSYPAEQHAPPLAPAIDSRQWLPTPRFTPLPIKAATPYLVVGRITLLKP